MSAGGADPIIAVRDLWKRYGEREALRGVSFDAAAGSCFGVFGANGAGKSTLLRVLATLIEPSAGTVRIAGAALPAEAAAVRARIGALFDAPMVPRDFTLEEGLTYYAGLYRRRAPRARAEELAERVGLGWRIRDPLRTFSRGMLQRAALACALAAEPEILIRDEPFTALARAGCRLVEEAIGAQRARGGTVLLVTHETERGARLCDEAIVLRAGRVHWRGERGAWSERDLIGAL
ncbi:MAG: ABC transporter ATP-binding protein [Planctomycetes bacterium]|nr:ABC transporter ATP-binding protein [Planctomycetota bacterium]